jgi:malate dehydrogenase (oxaloacetate-decarboxylating)(NADP+)
MANVILGRRERNEDCVIADALPVGPILVGPAKPAHVLTPSVAARGIVNMTAIAAAEAAGAE